MIDKLNQSEFFFFAYYPKIFRRLTLIPIYWRILFRRVHAVVVCEFICYVKMFRVKSSYFATAELMRLIEKLIVVYL